MSPPTNPIEDSTVEQVATFVRDGIISGEFPPAAKLLPKRIAEQCGTSFIPVREALRLLASEGFVTFVHNRGVWVTPLSKADLHEIYTLRIELECEAIRQAEPFSEAEIAHLDDLLQALQAHHHEQDHAGIVALNRELHFSIYAKSGSPRRLRLIDQLWLHSARYQRLVLDFRHDAADAEHRTMVDELRRGDHDAAALALQTHLETTVRLMSAGIDDDPDGDSADAGLLLA